MFHVKAINVFVFNPCNSMEAEGGNTWNSFLPCLPLFTNEHWEFESVGKNVLRVFCIELGAGEVCGLQQKCSSLPVLGERTHKQKKKFPTKPNTCGGNRGECWDSVSSCALLRYGRVCGAAFPSWPCKDGLDINWSSIHYLIFFCLCLIDR